MMALMAAVVATAITVSAEEAAKCCSADVAKAGGCAVAKMGAKADCVACAGCKESGKVCEKCAAKCHMISIKDGKATCCGCAKDCKCTVKEGDTKCSCGKEIKTCDLKGKFVCDCGLDCKCKKISDKAGKCECGKDYKEVK